jgi:hypothetical protein
MLLLVNAAADAPDIDNDNEEAMQINMHTIAIIVIPIACINLSSEY